MPTSPATRGSAAGYGFDRDLANAAMGAASWASTRSAIPATRGTRFLETTSKPIEAANRRGSNTQSHAPPPAALQLGVTPQWNHHAVEDMGWAETRLGPQRIWAPMHSTLRKQGAADFNADSPGSDHSIFYGSTPRSPAATNASAPGRLVPGRALTIEEACALTPSGPLRRLPRGQRPAWWPRAVGGLT
jgi:hypothetical protein